jgi:uncharacterized protein
MLGDLLVKYRYALLLLLACTTLYSVFGLFRIEIKQDFSTYFPRGDADRKFYEQIVAELGDEDDILSIALPNEGGIFDTSFLQKAHEFTLFCNGLEQVERAFSLTNLEDAIKTPFGIVPQPFLSWDSTGQFNTDQARLAADPRIAERLISKNGKALLVTMKLKPGLSPLEDEAIIAGLESKLNEMGFGEAVIGGLRYYEVSYNRASNRELVKGTVLCIGVLVVLLSFIYRSGWGVLMPLLVFSLSLLNFLGYLVARGHPLDTMSNLFPTIMLVVSVCDVIHIFSKFEERIKEGRAHREAVGLALNDAGLAIFITAFTTAVGFVALAISDIPATTRFGLDMAVGVLIACCTSLTLLAGLMPLVRPTAFVATDFMVKKWEWGYGKIVQLTLHHGKKVRILALVLALVGIVSIFFINTDHRLESAVSTDALKKSVHYFDTQTAGVRSFEVAILPQGSTKLNELAALQEIEKLHVYLDSLPQLGGIYSPVTVFKSLNMAMNNGLRSAYQLPESQEELERAERAFRKFHLPFASNILNKERSMGKISARVPDMGRHKIRELDRQVEDWASSHLDAKLIKAKVTGASHMVDRVQEISIESVPSGLIFSFVVIALLMGLLFKDFKIVLISIVVNVLPLFLTAIFMAILGIELRYGTSIMFTIGFVIAEDDTIHFLTQYKLERQRQPDEKTAIFEAMRHSGHAMLLTAILLAAGFGILITSDFNDSRAIGLLTSIMVFFAIFTDLLLCPSLLMKAFVKTDSTKT